MYVQYMKDLKKPLWEMKDGDWNLKNRSGPLHA